MKRTVTNFRSPTLADPHETGAVPGIPLPDRLAYLSQLSGLTCFEREFIARLRAKQPDSRELSVLEHIWQRHGRKCDGGAL